MTTYHRAIHPSRPLATPLPRLHKTLLIPTDPRWIALAVILCVASICIAFWALFGPAAMFAPPALVLLGIALVDVSRRFGRAMHHQLRAAHERHSGTSRTKAAIGTVAAARPRPHPVIRHIRRPA